MPSLYVTNLGITRDVGARIILEMDGKEVQREGIAYRKDGGGTQLNSPSSLQLPTPLYSSQRDARSIELIIQFIPWEITGDKNQ